MIRKPNYMRIIEKAVMTGQLITTPGVFSIAHVYHDDWCAIFKGEPCDCRPEVVVEYPKIEGKAKT